MILTVDEVKNLPEFSALSDTDITERLTALELKIRAYTHNNFQNRFVRFRAASDGSTLFGASEFLKSGDTVQISQSQVNDGMYVVKSVSDETTTIDGSLFAFENNLVTKVEYPADIKRGVLDLMRWDVRMADKAGIKSETLSRYSVTYADADATNQIMGYPVALLGFLKPYMKARF